MAIGSSLPKFRFVDDWPRSGVPADTDFTDIDIDAEGRVFAFARSTPEVIVYSGVGDQLASFGRDLFDGRPHGITVASDGSVYCVEDKGSTVRQFTLSGEFRGFLGPNGSRSDTGADWSAPNTIKRLETVRPEGGPPYNHPTKVAVGPDGTRYVSDGYGNCKVHCFDVAGELTASWGKSGIEPGEFHLPHSVLVFDNRLYVSDRENDRVQIFDLGGRYLSEWRGLRRPNSLASDGEGLFAIAESPVKVGRFSFLNGPATAAAPARTSLRDSLGELLGIVEDPRGSEPHGLAFDQQGNLFAVNGGKLAKYERI